MGDIECMFAAGECRGAYGVGLMHQLLLTHGSRFHGRVQRASGVSVGAFTAVAMSHADAVERLDEWTQTMLCSDLVHVSKWGTMWRAAKLKYLGDVKGGTGSLYTSDIIRTLFRKIMPAAPRTCALDIGVMPCSNEDTTQHSFHFDAGSHGDGAELEKTVLASSAIMGVFPPQRLADGRMYSDLSLIHI